MGNAGVQGAEEQCEEGVELNEDHRWLQTGYQMVKQSLECGIEL